MIWLKLTSKALIRQSLGHPEPTLIGGHTIMFVIQMKCRTHFNFGCVGPWSMRMKAIIAWHL